MQSKNSTICRYINLQELYFTNSSTDQFTPYSYKTATQRYLPLNAVNLHCTSILLPYIIF